MAYIPRTEFATALNQVASERGLDASVILETIREAIVAAYHRDCRERGIILPEDEEYEVEVNPETGEAKIFKKAGKKREDITPPGFGRIAAQTAKQVILQKIREAEKSAVLEEYSKRAGTLVSGMILRFDGPNVIVEIGKTEAVMPPQEQVRSEGYKTNQRLTFYLEGIKEGPRGQQVVVSRASKGLVQGLFKREVPEVSSGAVEIVEIAREPGARTKIAVSSHQPGVDPVGSCVGQKGVRVQEVIQELNGEKIDIIQYNEDLEKFMVASLSPAQGIAVKIDKKLKTAQVVMPEDQLSLAIGREGQNVRLAAKLTGYKIDIVGEGVKKEKKPVTQKAQRSPRKAQKKTKAETPKKRAKKTAKK